MLAELQIKLSSDTNLLESSCHDQHKDNTEEQVQPRASDCLILNRPLTGHFAKVQQRKKGEYQFLTCPRVGSLLWDDFCRDGMQWCFNRWRWRRCGFALTAASPLSRTKLCALPYMVHKGLKLSSGCFRKLHCRGSFCIISERHFSWE